MIGSAGFETRRDCADETEARAEPPETPDKGLADELAVFLVLVGIPT